jgi:hypothetical protein
MRESLVARLRYGIIRPYVEAFCKYAVSQGIELFIYTASEPQWAAFLVPCIEQALGVRFNRPILTRAHCTQILTPSGAPQFKKSLAAVLPILHARLRRSRGGRRGANAQAHANAHAHAELRRNIIMVDNTPGIMLSREDGARVVTCPTYDYFYLYDVLERIDIDTRHHKHKRIARILAKFGLMPPEAPAHVHAAMPSAHARASLSASASTAQAAAPTFQTFVAAYYQRIAHLMGVFAKPNQRCLREDRFFAHMLSALSSLGGRDFDAAAVERLTKRTRPPIPPPGVAAALPPRARPLAPHPI